VVVWIQNVLVWLMFLTGLNTMVRYWLLPIWFRNFWIILLIDWLISIHIHNALLYFYSAVHLLSSIEGIGMGTSFGSYPTYNLQWVKFIYPLFHECCSDGHCTPILAYSHWNS
jgi:hypothetical protein